MRQRKRAGGDIVVGCGIVKGKLALGAARHQEGRVRRIAAAPHAPCHKPTIQSILLLLLHLLSSPELSDTKVYELAIRALIRTASHFCEVVVQSTHPSTKNLVEAAIDWS